MQAEIYFSARFERSAGNFEFDTELNSPPSDGWVSIVVTAHTTRSTIATVGADISGQFHQRWIKFSESESVPSPMGSSLANGDTHFLTPAAGSSIFRMEEDNNYLHTPPYAVAAIDTDDRDYGIGSELHASWSIPLAGRTNSLDIAYLVVPDIYMGSTGTVLHAGVGLSNGETLSRDMYLCGGSGDVTLGLCDYDPPEIAVSGNDMPISNNDTTPTLLDGTDFGIVEMGSTQERTFRVRNLGLAPLELQPPVLTGPFSIVGDFPTSALYYGTNPFTVALNTSTPGTYQGTISFGNNDSNENPYRFRLAARVIPEPSTLAPFAIGCAAIGYRRRR